MWNFFGKKSMLTSVYSFKNFTLLKIFSATFLPALYLSICFWQAEKIKTEMNVSNFHFVDKSWLMIS
jgi:hypothetical protein